MAEIKSRNMFELLPADESDSEKFSGSKNAKGANPGRTNYSSRGTGRARIDPKSLIVNKESSDARQNARGTRGRGGRGKGREFDRRSASGRTDTEKSQRQGWGDPVKESLAVDEEEKENDNEEKAPKASEKQPASPELDEVKTYQEYLAEKADKALSLSKQETRPVMSSLGDPKFSAAKLLQKEEEENLFGIKKAENKQKTRKERNVKPVIDIEQKFTSSTRGRGTSDGYRPSSNDRRESRPNNAESSGYNGEKRRGGGFRARGGARRGGAASTREKKEDGSIGFDENSFPTLGAKQ